MSKRDAASTWQDLMFWYKQHSLEASLSLNPGVDSISLENFDKEFLLATGSEVPQELHDIYSLCNGQAVNASVGAIFGLFFLSLDDAYEHWQRWCDMASGDPELAALDGESCPSMAVKAVYINSCRIPFAYDWAGNYLGVDLDPGPIGTYGQVINYGADERVKYVLASSLTAFFEWILEQYMSGNYIIVPTESEETTELSIQIRFPRSESFLDALPFLLSKSPQ